MGYTDRKFDEAAQKGDDRIIECVDTGNVNNKFNDKKNNNPTEMSGFCADNQPENAVNCPAENSEYEVNDSAENPENDANDSTEKPEYDANDSAENPENAVNCPAENSKYSANDTANEPEYNIRGSAGRPEYDENDSAGRPEYSANDTANNPEYIVRGSAGRPEYDVYDSDDDTDEEEYLPEKPKKARGFGFGIFIGILIMLGVVIAAVVVYASVTLYGTSSTSLEYRQKLEWIEAYVNTYYLGTIDETELSDSVADGYIAGIGDKYADYYTAEEYASMMDGLTGSYVGIGVLILLNENNETQVVQVYEDSSAEKAGIKAGDIILAVDGRTDFENNDELVSAVRGEEGTTVDITVRHTTGETETLTVERRTTIVPTVAYEMLDNNIGYIVIGEFDTATIEQFKNALDDLESQGMKAVIFDLRSNPGGEYNSVVAMADRVLPEGVIVTTKDKNGNEVISTSDGENQLTIPAVVLVNESTASAAELFAGALQDYGIAEIVGKTTYGKGVVQSFFKLADGSGMKFTTSEYYLPSGRCIDGEGITPDYEVDLPEEAYEDGIISEDEDTQLKKGVEVLTEKIK